MSHSIYTPINHKTLVLPSHARIQTTSVIRSSAAGSCGFRQTSQPSPCEQAASLTRNEENYQRLLVAIVLDKRLLRKTLSNKGRGGMPYAAVTQTEAHVGRISIETRTETSLHGPVEDESNLNIVVDNLGELLLGCWRKQG